jgi:hypothetical protein
MRKCNFCHTDFIGYSLYCSKECFNNAHTRCCLHCKKQFILENLAYERRGYGKYCSMGCSRFATKIFSLNERYFESIDCPTKAYWLGFCMADAYNSGDELIFELCIKDINHLYKLQKDLEANNIVKSIKDNKYCKTRFGSRILCNHLINLGCIPKKSLVLKFPNINNIYYRDFIRGVFDGDGCIYIGKKNKQWSIYSGSEQFMQKIYKILLQNNIKVKWRTQGKGFVVCVYSKQEIKNIYHYLYDDAITFLKRKADKFGTLTFLKDGI